MTSAPSIQEPVIRPATEDDLPVLMGLFEELSALQKPWRVFTPRPNLSEEMRRRYEAALDDPDALLLVAEQDGQIVGMAAGHVHKPSMSSEELAVELGSVYVTEGHRERGVAGALTAEVVRFARECGVNRLTLKTFAQNEEALLAWVRLGFEPRMIQMTATVDRLEHPGPDSGPS